MADAASRRVARFRAEYRAAQKDARTAHAELARALRQRRCPLREIARAAKRAHLAAARLYTAAACLLSPP